MALSGEEVQRLTRQREILLGLLAEAENGRTSSPAYDGMPTDPVDASIQATREKLAKIEKQLKEADGAG